MPDETKHPCEIEWERFAVSLLCDEPHVFDGEAGRNLRIMMKSAFSRGYWSVKDVIDRRVPDDVRWKPDGLAALAKLRAMK